MEVGLIDFHCHLHDSGGYKALAADQGDLLRQAPTVLSVTNTPADWRTLSRSRDHSQVAWALGLHPQERHTRRSLEQFSETAARADAIGEVGLDYSRANLVDHATQLATLRHVLGTPASHERIVSFHSRGATTELLGLLANQCPAGAILHWFLGSASDIDRAVGLNVYFSMNENMISSQQGQRVIRELPPNRVLLESDAPYGGIRGTKNKPGDLRNVVRYLAKVWHRSLESTEDLIESNQRAFLGRIAVVPQVLQDATLAR